MLAYQRGDEHAFDRIVHAYSGQVFSLVTRFLGPVSHREDLVQEVFLRLIRARERYQPTARLSTWLYRIVYNLSINERERLNTRARTTSDFETDPETGAVEVEDAKSGLPSEGLERADVVRAVRQAILRLPENQRMALILAKYEEMPYGEVAHVLGSTEKAIKSLIHRARENLRSALTPFLAEEMA